MQSLVRKVMSLRKNGLKAPSIARLLDKDEEVVAGIMRFALREEHTEPPRPRILRVYEEDGHNVTVYAPMWAEGARETEVVDA